MSWCGFLWVYPLWVPSTSWICRFMLPHLGSSTHYLFERFSAPRSFPSHVGTPCQATEGHGWGWLWSVKTQEGTVRFRQFVILWTGKGEAVIPSSHVPKRGWMTGVTIVGGPLLEAVLYSEGLGRLLCISSGQVSRPPWHQACLPSLSCGRSTGCRAFVRVAWVHVWEGGRQSSPGSADSNLRLLLSVCSPLRLWSGFVWVLFMSPAFCFLF